MLGAVAQFERDLIIERTCAGLAAARKRGKRLGPPVKWQADMARKAQALLDKGDLNAEEVARTLKVSQTDAVPRAQRQRGTTTNCWGVTACQIRSAAV